jgi:deazaflavin-dependent oxidoreductase (nitroreductase family)
MPMNLTARRPHGIVRLLFRLPILLYKAHLGWLVGRRFLLLTHKGRKSGRPRQTVLEVVEYKQANDVLIVASGWGNQSDWYQNILKTPEVVVDFAGRQSERFAAIMSQTQAAQTLFEYSQKYPRAYRLLARELLGRPLKNTREDCEVFSRQVPLVEIWPRESRN